MPRTSVGSKTTETPGQFIARTHARMRSSDCGAAGSRQVSSRKEQNSDGLFPAGFSAKMETHFSTAAGS